MTHRCFLIALTLPFSACAAPADFKLAPPASKLSSPAITEASGMAVSPTCPALFWIINDSGGTPDIHLTGADGADLGKLALKDAPNIDWEDLASFTLDGKPYLLVADTGDNGSKRDSCVLYIVPEPTIPASGEALAATASPAWQIRFRYEGGPRDCEAVAVDVENEKIILISKRTKPPEIHELPLRPTGKRGIMTTRRVGTTDVKPPGGSLMPFSDQPTGLDISADETLAAVVTYHGIFLFTRATGESWADAFAKPALALAPHHLGQAESVAFSTDGKSIRTVAEGKHSAIRIYQNLPPSSGKPPDAPSSDRPAQ